MLGLPPGVDACLFDLDGVLTDTASVHLAAWKEAFGPPFTDEDYLRHVDGKPRYDGVRDYLTALRGSPPPEDEVRRIGDRKNELVQELIARDGVVVFEGSRRYLQACTDAGVRRAVVSSSANTALVLRVTGLDAFIEVVVDGTRHLPGKPRPDTFLTAAAELDRSAAQCAVFEDALAGVEAGRAGRFGLVVGVDRVGQAEALKDHGAGVVVQDLGELLAE